MGVYLEQGSCHWLICSCVHWGGSPALFEAMKVAMICLLTFDMRTEAWNWLMRSLKEQDITGIPCP